MDTSAGEYKNRGRLSKSKTESFANTSVPSNEKKTPVNWQLVKQFNDSKPGLEHFDTVILWKYGSKAVI